MTAPLRIGYVPEHFSTPIHFLLKHILPGVPAPFSTGPPLAITLVPFPSGTGHMITSLESHSVDIAIGLTEGFIAGLAQGKDFYRIIGSYVESVLRWAISTGAEREDAFLGGGGGGGGRRMELKGRRLGVSRIGSGSYVMGYVLAEREGWLEQGKEPFEFVVLNDFKGLRDGVNDGDADAFMWEYYTSKKYYKDQPPALRQIGEIPTPWPSWHIVAHSSLLRPSSTSNPTAQQVDPRIPLFLTCLNSAVAYFNAHPDEAVDHIAGSKEMHYSAADARSWLSEVKFVADTRVVRLDVVRGCVDVLRRAGVVPKEEEGKGVPVGEMVVRVEDAGVVDGT